MRVVAKLFVILWFYSGFSFAGNIEFLPYEKNEFSPILKEKVSIPFKLAAPATVSAEIYTPDGVLIRILSTTTIKEKAQHSLVWDGRDEHGIVVPDEAYNVVLKATINNKTEIIDPRTSSGGIVQMDLNPNINADGKMTYTLQTPSRVLIRLGLNSGAMLRSIITWVPKNAGKNIQFWDGYDQDHLIKFQKHESFKMVISAFSLADYSIITTGNKASYFDYVTKHSHQPSLEAKTQRLHQAKSKRSSPYYVRALTDTREPHVDFEFPKNIKRNAEGIPIVKKGDKIRIKIIMDEKDAIRMEKNKYEITFYDNLDFIAEEEMGYVPLSWFWSPKNEKGRHILTVNIVSFKGHVGVKSTPYIIE